MGLTQCVGQQLKNHGWNVEQAIDSYVYFIFTHCFHISYSIAYDLALLFCGLSINCYWLWTTLPQPSVIRNGKHTSSKDSERARQPKNG